MKTVTNILEKNKIHIKSLNSHLRKILSNLMQNNPTNTKKHVNNTDSTSVMHQEGKKDDHTKETEESNNLFGNKEKKTQVNKTLSQDREKELITDRLNLNKQLFIIMFTVQKNGQEFMIDYNECKA